MLSNNKQRSKSSIKIKGKLRYSTKNYQNPFFQKSAKSSLSLPSANISRRVKMISLLTLILLAAMALFLIYSHYFDIREIIVTGTGQIENQTIEDHARQQIKDNILAIIPQRNIFLFSASRLTQTLNRKYALNSLTIKRKLPNSLIIDYREKEYAFILEENNNFFYADKHGHIITEANLLEVNERDYPIILNLSDDRIYNDQTQINAKYLEAVFILFSIFKDHSEELKIERYIIDKEINTIKVGILAGPQVYINIENDIDKQINKLLVIKNEKLKDNFVNKTYIDVRYGDSVYYR